jgi:MYXO-CTERM domain-containing protein
MTNPRTNQKAFMNKRTMRSKLVRGAAVGAALLGLGTLFTSDALGEGVVYIETSKSLPAATVAVIDPEGGGAVGGSSDVNLFAGDIILFQFNFTPVPDATNRGMNGYLTEYIPQNTEVVGMRLINKAGLSIKPNRAGFAIDGCSMSPNCGADLALAGTGSTPRGSVYDVHADVGIFYTTDALLTKNPVDQFITMNNGISMASNMPRWITPGLVALLNDSTAPYFVHNFWDWIQIVGMGSATDAAGTGGSGASPFEYGSPVAGPETHYPYEAETVDSNPATQTASDIRFNDNDGPWNRVVYPGSRIGVGAAGTGNATYSRDDADASGLGFDITPANPVSAVAMRAAMGETRTGEPAFAEVALRVLDTGPPIDPDFGANGGNVDCSEVHGTDVAYRGGNNGDDHPWGFYIASPACVFLRLLFELEVNKDLMLDGAGADETYTINGSNLAVFTEENVQVRLKFDSSRQSYVPNTSTLTINGVVITDDEPDMNVTCPDDATKQCLIWLMPDLAPSDDYKITAKFEIGGSGQTSNVMYAQYISDSLPAPGYTNQEVTIVRPIAVMKMAFPPASQPASVPSSGTVANRTADLTGSISNVGTADFTITNGNALTFWLPTSSWTITGTWKIGGQTMVCVQTGRVVGCNPPSNADDIVAGGSLALELHVVVPTGEPLGLYNIDASYIGSQPSFGGDFETFFPEVVTIPVGAPRSATPVVTCPINSSSATAITGTVAEAAGTEIDVYFNLIPRGTAVSSGSGPGTWSSTDWTAFGELYGGLEVTATAQAVGENLSLPSLPCYVSTTHECSDGLDNDNDQATDFPADLGCDSLNDNTEDTVFVAPECSDLIDNADPDTDIDWTPDLQCYAPYDPTEGEDGFPGSTNTACTDGQDNDGDGVIDGADPDCNINGGQSEHDWPACMDGRNNDNGDALVDFPADPGCHSAFDDSEENEQVTGPDRARIMLVLDSSGSMNLDTCVYPAPGPGQPAPGFTGGDGSVECPGFDRGTACPDPDTQANDSRLYKIKAGLTNVVTAFGEVDWGLMRFHQRDTDFACPTQNQSGKSGAWQGGGVAPCGGGFNAGDLLVRFSANNPDTILGWIDNDSNYSGPTAPRMLDYEVRGSGTTPLAGSLQSAYDIMTATRTAENALPGPAPDNCRPYRVILLTDGKETCDGNPVTEAGELLAAGMPVYVIGFATNDTVTNTSLNAIAAAGGTGTAVLVDDEVELSAAIAEIVEETVRFELCNDLDDDCDGAIDEDFTDLDDVCNDGEAGICFDTGNIECSADGTGTECDADDESGVGSEGTVCNNLDDDCDGAVDENLVCPVQCGPEACNGDDDDCDGTVDEDTVSDPPPTCGTDVGVCDFGTLACVGGEFVCQGGNQGGAETCNTLDDDCDNQTDELSRACYTFGSGCNLNTGVCQGFCQIGVQVCSGNAFGACQNQVGPGTEVCNGIDDDCDGTVDDGFPNLGNPCSVGQGICAANGTIVCNSAGNGTVCNAPVITGSTEICNCLDDDCDGQVDDNLGAPIGNACGGTDNCGVGQYVCDNQGAGALCQPVCEGAGDGQEEVCNGLDDDCDLIADDNVGVGQQNCVDRDLIDEDINAVPCSPGCDQEPGCTAENPCICVEGNCVAGDTGECEYGDLMCQAIEDCDPATDPYDCLTCVGYQGPATTEVCNLLDDDCDGVPDDNAECPNPDDICVEGQCVFLCSADEFPCPFGFFCSEDFSGTDDYCLPDPCVTDPPNCPDGSFCQSGTGQCIDLCEGNNCGEKMCQDGLCVDCEDLGCPEDQNCIDVGTFSECQDNLCFEVDCGDDESCDPETGDCQSVNCGGGCADGELCLDGECVVDMCEGVDCDGGEICDPTTGDCVEDMCRGVSCPTNEVCNPADGECIANPCENRDCPDGTQCDLDLNGDTFCRDLVGEYVFAGGSGCGCQSGSSGGQAGGLLMMLGITLLAWRRRRKK